MKVWLFQDHRQRQRHGERAPWSVGFYDPAGNKIRKRIGSRSLAERYAQRIAGELAAGTYQSASRIKWTDFTAAYEAKIVASMGPANQAATRLALGNFQRIVKPKRLAAIKNDTIDAFIAARRREKIRGDKYPEATTINRDLRHLKAALRKAVEWGMLEKCPTIKQLRAPVKEKAFIDDPLLVALYKAATVAKVPTRQPYSPPEWWRALFVVAYMTGWRIGQILKLRWDDVDLENATALSRYQDNKGQRDHRIDLHPLVVAHLGQIRSLSPLVFPWPTHRKKLYDTFAAIQEAAAVKPAGGKPRFGFHDFRRGFATNNALRMTADELRRQMQHSSYQTTQGYIQLARDAARTADKLHVPALPFPARTA